MVQDDEYIQTLTKLGLTFLQAKTYLTLARLGKADVKTISKASKVARQDIYRIIPALQNMGLVEKILATPTIYKVTSINEGLSILLQNKTQEYVELQMKINDLLNNLQSSKAEEVLQDADQQFRIISSKALLYKRLADKDKKVQESIDAVAKWETLRAALFHRHQDFMSALKRGIRIRMITETCDNDNSVQKIIQTLKRSPLFEIRYMPSPIPVNAVIHDKTEINMCIATLPDNDVPSLCSTNSRFLKVMIAYFEELWNNALKAPAHKSAKSTL